MPIVAAALTLTVLVCQAQVATRSVSGVVTGSSGEPLFGAVVKLKSPEKAPIRSYITQEDGRYRFTGLNPLVDYTVQARSDQGSSRSVYLNHVSSRNERIVDLRIMQSSRRK